MSRPLSASCAHMAQENWRPASGDILDSQPCWWRRPKQPTASEASG